MFLLISSYKTVHQYGVSIQSSTKVRETFWQITQKLWATKTWDLDKLFKNKSFITFIFLASYTGRFPIYFFVVWQWIYSELKWYLKWPKKSYRTFAKNLQNNLDEGGIGIFGFAVLAIS